MKALYKTESWFVYTLQTKVKYWLLISTHILLRHVTNRLTKQDRVFMSSFPLFYMSSPSVLRRINKGPCHISTVMCRSVTMRVGVQHRETQLGVCGGRSVTGTGLSLSIWFFCKWHCSEVPCWYFDLQLTKFTVTTWQNDLIIIIIIIIITPSSTVTLEKLTGSQLIKKFPSFYGTRRFIITFKSARRLSLSQARSIQSMPPHPISWRPILKLSSHLHLGLPRGLLPYVSPPTSCMHL